MTAHLSQQWQQPEPQMLPYLPPRRASEDLHDAQRQFHEQMQRKAKSLRRRSLQTPRQPVPAAADEPVGNHTPVRSSPTTPGRASMPVLTEREMKDFRKGLRAHLFGSAKDQAMMPEVTSPSEADNAVTSTAIVTNSSPVITDDKTGSSSAVTVTTTAAPHKRSISVTHRGSRKVLQKRRSTTREASSDISTTITAACDDRQPEEPTSPPPRHYRAPPVSLSSTIMTGHAMSPYKGAVSEYAPLELDQPISDFMGKAGNRQSHRMSRTSPGKPLLHENKLGQSYPAPLNRPRKLSTTVTVTPVSQQSQRPQQPQQAAIEVPETRRRSSSWAARRGSQQARERDSATFQAYRPEYTYNQRTSVMPMRTTFHQAAPSRQPNELFACLPAEALRGILNNLKQSHLDPKSESCSTCWMRDVCSIATASRRWRKYALASLYEDIQLNGDDSPTQKKRYKIAHSSRLVLLRRSLRANPSLAKLVKTLKVPSPPADVPLEEYHTLVATLVMECPNFERLVGLNPHYSQTFSRLFHALSTRSDLKQMDWILDSSSVTAAAQRPSSRPGSRPGSSHGKPSILSRSRRNSFVASAPTPEPQEDGAFLDYHSNWAQLETLTIHCLPGSSLATDSTLFTRILKRLPSLKHLYVTRMSPAAFNDRTLRELPALETLSLSYVPGVTGAGLSAFATLPSSRAMKQLTLRHVNLDSLPALVRVFSNLANLQSFTFVQSSAPHLPEDTMIWLMPYMASLSLRKLHWDVTTPCPLAAPADSIFARSIAAGGFPSLRTIRAPNDPEGVFQALCRPVACVDAASMRPGGGLIARCGTLDSLASMSTGSGSVSSASSVQSPRTPTSPFADGLPASPTLRETSDLRDARQAAQGRLEAARSQPKFLVNVTDEAGEMVDKFSMAGFMGSQGSNIRYNLMPDPGARDENGGLVEISDVQGDCGEALGETREGCIGRWNASVSGHVDRVEKELWWHTERGRWNPLELV